MWMALGVLGLIIFIIGVAFLIVTLIKKWSPIIPTVLLCSGGALMIIGFVSVWGNSPVMEEASEEERERDPEQYENFIKGASISVSYDEMVNASEKIEGFISVEGVVSDSVGGGIENFILKSDEGDILVSSLDLNNEYNNGDYVKVYGLHNFESSNNLPAISASVVDRQ